MDWDELFFKGIFVFFIGVTFLIVGGYVYMCANSEIKSTEMELEILVKEIDKDTYTSMVGKTPVVRTDTDYYLVCGNESLRVSIEVDRNIYNSCVEGDRVIVVKDEYIYNKDGEIWETKWRLK